MSHAQSRSLVEHALSLIAGAAVERPEKAQQLRAELERWRSVSLDHQVAYERAVREWQSLDAVGPQLRARFAEPSLAARRKKGNAGTLLAIAAFVMTFAALLNWHFRQPVLDRAFETGTAQLSRVPLPDGSRIDLNAKTALRIVLYRDRRSVELKHGEARFEVAPDSSRPFRVETREGTVEAVGTVFVISDRGDKVTVTVERGRVLVVPVTRSPGVMLNGGERVSVSGGAVGDTERTGAIEFAPWRDGWLVFDNERLADALPAINAFRAAPIRLGDDAAGALRLTGRFRAADSRGLLAALPRVLPVAVTETDDGTVRINSR